MRPLPLPYLTAHLLINTNILTSYISVLIYKNILNSSLPWSKSSETNPWYRLLCFWASHGFTQDFLFFVFKTLICFINSFITCEHAAKTERAPNYFSPFSAWCRLKGHTYLNKPAAESCRAFFKYVRPFSEHQALKG